MAPSNLVAMGLQPNSDLVLWNLKNLKIIYMISSPPAAFSPQFPEEVPVTACLAKPNSALAGHRHRAERPAFTVQP